MAKNKRLYTDHQPTDPKGAQRLTVERLQQWQRLEYGMFIHFGIATFTTDLGNLAPGDYQPPGPPDTDQWARVARDAGMRYIILTTQHCNSFCLWHTDVEGVANVRQSAEPTDVVASFVESCRKYDIVPAFYFSIGRFTAMRGGFRQGLDVHESSASRQALDCCKAMLDELLTRFGPIGEIWIDGPVKYGAAGRHELYEHVTALQPGIVFAYNGWGVDQIRLPRPDRTAWPTDVIVLEVLLPPFAETSPWRKMQIDQQGKSYPDGVDLYLPVESCCVIHRSFTDWFYDPDAILASDDEILGMRLVAKARNANLVLNVTPDRTGRIPDDQATALARVAERMPKP